MNSRNESDGQPSFSPLAWPGGQQPGTPNEPGEPTQPNEPGEPTIPDQPPPAPVA